jgi:hypothetical protein
LKRRFWDNTDSAPEPEPVNAAGMFYKRPILIGRGNSRPITRADFLRFFPFAPSVSLNPKQVRG